MYLISTKEKKKKIYFGNLKNYSKRINVKLPITKTTDIHIEKVWSSICHYIEIQYNFVISFFPEKKKDYSKQW